MKEKAGAPVRFSLRTKNMLLLGSLFALMIAALWLINRFGLERYYQRQQLVRLESARQNLEALAADSGNEELKLDLTVQCESSGIAAVLVQGASGGMGASVILFSAGDEERGLLHFMERELGFPRRPEDIYAQSDSYIIYKNTDPVTKSEKISCLGSMKTAGGASCVYLMTLSLARIAESARLSNRFLLLIGLGILAVGVGAVFLITGRITGPIVKLSGISRKMAALDFSERYNGSGSDEIQALGDNINEMAETLEKTIGDLREANLKLEQDVYEKEQENLRRKELLANISHELKTPIALIQGYAEGLRDGMCEDEELRVRYSDIIIDESERMNRLVRQLLSLNELESGRAEIEKSEFDLSVLIREITASYEMKSGKEGLKVEVDVPESLPVRSDELLTEQIVQNYLSNAFHYVKKDGCIRISAERREADGAVIRVYNEGDPIPEEALSQIWNKFYKVDKARTRSYGGSGIGLSIVKAAAQILGGGCRAENRENGVEFTAWI